MRLGSSKGNQFFSRRGVDCDGVVEISLTGAHLYGDGEALDHFVGALADDVNANDSFFGTLYDEFEGGRLLVMFFDHAEVERLEGSFVDLDTIWVLLSSLRLGQTDGPYGRVREDDGGDIFVTELVILEFRRTKETVGEPPSSGDGDRGQEPLAGDIANGRDAENVRVLVIVDDDVAFVGGRDPEVFQTEFTGVGLTADCPQEDVGVYFFAGVGVNGQISVFALDFRDLGPTVYVDAGVFHPRSEYLLDVRVKSSKDGFTADEEMGLGSKRVEDAGEFDGDVTSADDDDASRLVFEFEETIRGDTEVSSWNLFLRGDGRATADGDANVTSVHGVGLLTRGGDLDLGGGKDGGVTVEEVDALPFPVNGVDTTELLDISVSLELEGSPVELWLLDVFELVACGLANLVREIGGMPHQLFWDASDVDTGASVVWGGFDDCHFLSVRSSATGTTGTTAATTNEDDVVFFGKLKRGHLGRVECSIYLG